MAGNGKFQQEVRIETNPLIWEHQRELFSQIKGFYAAGREKVLVQACTGSGKTGVIAMAPWAVEDCKKVLVIAPNADVKAGEHWMAIPS